MKQLTVAVLGNAVFFLLLSCGSFDLSKKYPNMVADADPFSVGSAEAQFDRLFTTKVNKTGIQAVFHPRLNAVSLEFKYELLTYRQFWDEPARKQFAAALELYKRDFEDRKLIDNYRKTRAVYGNVKGGRLEWETSKLGRTRVSNPIIELGYRFKENSAFFTTFMRSAKDVTSSEEKSDYMDSRPINMYFTRAQADEIVKIFDQARLLELLQETTGVRIKEPSADAEEEDSTPEDAYHEYGE